MAGEKFPEVRPGQPISASRANQEGQVLERMAGMKPGDGMEGWHGATFVQFGRTQSTKLRAFRVALDRSPHSEARHAGTLRRFYPQERDVRLNPWKDSEKKWALDTQALGGYWPNDGGIITAYYDQKRGRYIPTSADELYFGMLMEPYTGPFRCFRIRLGVWCKELYRFLFTTPYDDDDALDAIGIDLNPFTYGDDQYVYFPHAGAKGWFKRMPSKWTPSGFIYVLIFLYPKIELEDYHTECPDPDETWEDPCIESSSHSSPSSLSSVGVSSSSFSSLSSSSGDCRICGCSWVWKGNHWEQATFCSTNIYYCLSCLCPQPSRPGNYYGELVQVACVNQ